MNHRTLKTEKLLSASPSRKSALIWGMLWEPVGHLQGSLGPSRPQTPTKSEKSLPGPPAPGPPRESGTSLEKVGRVWKKSRKGPERLFPDFVGVSGPEGPRDPCKWPTGPQGLLRFWGVSLAIVRGPYTLTLKDPF